MYYCLWPGGDHSTQDLPLGHIVGRNLADQSADPVETTVGEPGPDELMLGPRCLVQHGVDCAPEVVVGGVGHRCWPGEAVSLVRIVDVRGDEAFKKNYIAIGPLHTLSLC